jgi:hypothetical protein
MALVSSEATGQKLLVLFVIQGWTCVDTRLGRACPYAINAFLAFSDFLELSARVQLWINVVLRAEQDWL